MTDHPTRGGRPADSADVLRARDAAAVALFALRRDGWLTPAAVDMFTDRAPADALPAAVAEAYLVCIPDGHTYDRTHLAALDTVFDWEQRPDYAARQQAELCVWRLAGVCWVNLTDQAQSDLDVELAYRLAVFASIP